MNKGPTQLIAETRKDAISFLEDYYHLIDLVKKLETRSVNIRHASAILRRLLIENLLQKIASPRMGKIEILSINNNPIYKEARRETLVSFVSGGAAMHGIYIAAGMASKGSRALQIDGYSPESTLPLNLESFKKQRIIYTNGEWISREQVIKFVANVDRGVHSGKIKDRFEELLSAFSHEISIELNASDSENLLPVLSWRFGTPAGEVDFENYNPQKINGTLIEVLATIQFIISSPDIKYLANIIEKEVTG
ncbi:hypothetical protein K7H22_13030 [Seohaeicola saemankumensis]|uniref:hypothetical protein n=1 Tax=Seohaeicola saemankumensis TaxID=481181 RepID=UPI001E36A458|nr:hypothetical protein [Seohaeicola saemankumensis]MCD1626918.1 hypothetical protein [Seohaeicola saemankumensis]